MHTFKIHLAEVLSTASDSPISEVHRTRVIEVRLQGLFILCIEVRAPPPETPIRQSAVWRRHVVGNIPFGDRLAGCHVAVPQNSSLVAQVSETTKKRDPVVVMLDLIGCVCSRLLASPPLMYLIHLSDIEPVF